MLGRLGEWVVSREFYRLGYITLDRNWRCATGELDLVVAGRGELIVVEVKTRRAGSPVCLNELIDEVRRRRLRRLCQVYCSQFGWKLRRYHLRRMHLEVVLVSYERGRSGGMKFLTQRHSL